MSRAKPRSSSTKLQREASTQQLREAARARDPNAECAGEFFFATEPRKGLFRAGDARVHKLAGLDRRRTLRENERDRVELRTLRFVDRHRERSVVRGKPRHAYGTNAKVGTGDWIVVEADESDGTFLKLKSTCAVVTNIDPEHLDHYGDFDAVKKAFRDFVENIPFYGFAAICTDHPEVLAMAARVENRRLVTYGVNPQAEVRAEAITMGPDGARFDVVIRPREGEALRFVDLHLPMAGHHNVLNSLAAVAVARELGLDEAAIRKGLAEFGGVKRRFTTTGVAGGVRVVDDYAHHPVEIFSVLKAARAVTGGKVIAVVQPHRYSRLKDLFNEFCACFADADTVIVADVYAAGEAPLEGVSRESLVEGLRRYGHRRVLPLGAPGDLAEMVRGETTSGDLVVLLGAGDITSWAYALPGELEVLSA